MECKAGQDHGAGFGTDSMIFLSTMRTNLKSSFKKIFVFVSSPQT